MDLCPICLEELKYSYIETICNHKFHAKCFENYNSFHLINKNNLENKILNCPVCRFPIIKINRIKNFPLPFLILLLFTKYIPEKTI